MIRVDKGTAMACKARVALAWGDYETCAELCKEIMDMKTYSLYEDYGQLFREKAYTCETIWALPNSYAYEQTQSHKIFRQPYSRWKHNCSAFMGPARGIRVH